MSPALALDPGKRITQYRHDVWQAELPQSGVYAIVQTRDGYLWLGTQEGLVRFDGVRFTVFDRRNTPELGSSYVLSLLEDRRGRLWIGTNSGLVRLEAGRFTRHATREGVPGDRVHALLEDRRGRLWVGTGGGAARLEGGRFVGEPAVEALPGRAVRALLEDREGAVWMATESGLVRMKDGLVQVFTTNDGLTHKDIRALCEGRDGSLWIGTFGGGLNRLEGGRITAFRTPEGLTNDLVQSVYEDRSGSLWIGTYGGGLNRLLDGRITAFTTREGLSYDLVWSTFEDREGSLWIGTDGGGLNRLKDGKLTALTTREGLTNDMDQSVYEGRDGSIWIGTYGGGVSRLKDGEATAFTTAQGLTNDLVRSVCEDRDGNVWIGTYGGGLNRLRDGRLDAVTTRTGLTSDLIRSLYEGRDGSLWIGTDGGGLNRLKDGKLTALTTREGLTSDTILSLYEDRGGTLWIGTQGGGLNRLKDGVLTAITTREGLTNDLVESLYEDGEGSLWIGTLGGGLNRLKGGRITSVTTRQGLFDDVVFTMIEDDVGQLWMSCNKGVFRARKSDLDEVMDGKRERVTCVSYGTADGMKSTECNGGNQPSACKTRDGRLWFPTVRGVVVVDPRRLPTNSLHPPVAMEEVLVDGRPGGPSGHLRLPPGSHTLELHYTALSLLAPEKVLFKYRLEGFTPEWVDAGTRRTAYYTNLPQGEYRFRVVACNNDGLWNEEGATLAFTVEPRLYETTWFRLLSALALGATFFGAYRLRVRQLRARERELVAVVKERTRSLEERTRGLEEEKLRTEGALSQAEVARKAADEHSAEAERQRARADEANQAKSLFLANMSHELRTPLNVVLGFVQLIARDRTLKPEHREHLSTILSSGEHLLGLINDVLSISKIEAGHVPLSETDFDLRELVAGFEQVYGARAGAHGLAFRPVSPGTLPRVRGDAGKLRQILTNFLENAFRFTESGHVTLDASWEAGRASFRIEDTGPGISADELATLFLPFHQATAGQQSKGGTGLGLYISQSFVRRMGGEVEVTSTPGKGSCFAFHVNLPRADSTSSPLPEESTGHVIALEPGQRAFRILAVDDIAANRDILAKLLSSVGLDVRQASSGEEAVATFTTWRPDLIWMDIRMPGMDGYEATRRIREAEGDERLTVIVGLTASAFEHDREAILKAGCDDYLPKPFREAALFRCMTRHLGVRFLAEAAPPVPPPADPALTRERLASLPSDLRDGLRGALEQGDVQSARGMVEKIRAHDEALAATVSEAIREFQLDQLLELVEEAAEGR